MKTFELVILETSDLHCNILSYDYYNDKKVEHYGLAKLATLIQEVRERHPHNILVDNGDLLQGSAFADYVVRHKNPTDVHPMLQAMNTLKYDLAGPGNHDFNYGLSFLENAMSKAQFPYICANVYHRNMERPNERGEHIFTPSYILTKELEPHTTIKIGFTSVVPPQILIWDKKRLSDKLVVQDIVESAQEQVKILRQKGADLVIVLAHSGILPISYMPGNENAVYELCKIEGIDGILCGHAHNVFPSGKIFSKFEKLGIDNVTGKILGKPVVMPGAWGSHLGVLKFELQKKNHWYIKKTSSEALPIQNVTEDSKLVSSFQKEHAAVTKYLRQPVGQNQSHLYSWFAAIMPSLTVQLVQESIEIYARRELKETPYAHLPLICSCAPMNTGSHGSPYLDISPGVFSINHIFSVYPYDNEVKIVKVSGKQIYDWLEFSGRVFHQITPSSDGETTAVPLLNPAFPTFNFDCFSNVEYQIDVSQPIGQRICQLTHNGKEISPYDEFIVVTNDYRAYGGGTFPHLHGSNLILDSSAMYRDLLIEYIKEVKVISLKLKKNWKLINSGESPRDSWFESSLDSIQHKPDFLEIMSVDEATKKMKYLLKLDSN